MSLNFRAMAALCSVAVSLSSGCESAQLADSGSSGQLSPLFSSEATSVQDSIQPCIPSEDDLVQAELADCTILLSADSVMISGEGASVRDGDIVISGGGAYRLSGSGDQRIVLENSDDVSLILDGVQLNAPIESSSEAQLKLTLAENSDNTLNALYAIAGISSSGDIVVNGSGRLFVSGDSAIRSDGVVKLCGGDIELSARSNGIIGDGVSVSAGTVDIISDGNGISAAAAVYISGGEVKLSCGGGSSAVLMMESGGKYPYGRHGGFCTDGSREYDFDDLVSGDNTSPVSKKGIFSRGVVQIDGGMLDIDSADDSISAHGDIRIGSGELRIASGDDGIRSDGAVYITDGILNVIKSYTAIESISVDIGGGELRLTSYRDGIKAAGGNDIGFSGSDTESSDRYVSISGGSVIIDSGGDGIDTGGTAAMSGGEVTIFSENNVRYGSLDYDDSFALGGGTLAAFGSSGLTKAPSLVVGPCLSVLAEIAADTNVKITDSSGGVLFETVLPKPCSTVIFSCEALKKGGVYSVFAGETMVALVTALQGVSGDGPNGRGGVVDDMTESNTSGVVVA